MLSFAYVCQRQKNNSSSVLTLFLTQYMIIILEKMESSLTRRKSTDRSSNSAASSASSLDGVLATDYDIVESERAQEENDDDDNIAVIESNETVDESQSSLLNDTLTQTAITNLMLFSIALFVAPLVCMFLFKTFVFEGTEQKCRLLFTFFIHRTHGHVIAGCRTLWRNIRDHRCLFDNGIVRLCCMARRDNTICCAASAYRIKNQFFCCYHASTNESFCLISKAHLLFF